MTYNKGMNFVVVFVCKKKVCGGHAFCRFLGEK